jgi:hypothetical protein
MFRNYRKLLSVSLITTVLLFFPGCIQPQIPKRPVQLSNPKIVIGYPFLTKKQFLKTPNIGKVSDIVLIPTAQGERLGIAGTLGALFTTLQGRNISSTKFDQYYPNIQIVGVQPNGTCNFLNREGVVGGPTLIGYDGKPTRKYGGMFVDDITASDLDGDGALEFVAGYAGGGGVRRFETDGTQVWKQPDGNVWHLELARVNGNGRSLIVHSNAGGEMVLRDLNGSIVRQVKPEAYFSEFTLCPYPTRSDLRYPLICRDGYFWILDYNGKTRAKLKAPLTSEEALGSLSATPIQNKRDGKTYLAVAINYTIWDRTILSIYDMKGRLVYEEILPESCDAVLGIRDLKTDNDLLLVGGDKQVLKYNFD